MARVDVVMPKMGESVMEGTVLEWKKGVGDLVEQDETLLEISTDKVDSEVPSPEAGRIVEILVQENETVEVGVQIAVIETDINAEGGATPADPEPVVEAQPVAPAPEPVVEAAPEPEPAAPAAPVASTGGGTRVNVVMPKMGESVMEGTVLEWKKAVGDTVEQDETLLEISTDKVDSEVPSPEAGTLLEILVQENETVEVGVPIAVIGTGDAASASSSPAPTVPEATPAAPAAEAMALTQVETAAASQPSGDGAAVAEPVVHEPTGATPRRDDAGNFYSPLVRSIADAEGISLSELQSIQGSGSEGRVNKADVMAYLETREATPAPAQPAATPVAAAAPVPAPAAQAAQPPTRAEAATAVATPTTEASGERVEVIEMDRMRQLIAEHMRRSKDTSAHVTSFAEIDVTGLVAHREAHKVEFQKREGVKLTYTPYFIESAIEPLREHPLMNSSVEGTRILVKKDFHIGIAVAIGTKGLLVPVVRNAGQQNLTGLTHTIADIAERARTKRLQPDELQGGTFTITNVGSLGSLMGTPIINQPQSAILSPGAIVKRPVVMETEAGDVIAIRHMMYVSLTYDHRIIDGSMAASLLAAYRRQLEAIG
ncbi:MAG: 2-oxoglutarate dehydrogenase, E2 component, dihydrolipoamide succinyltransferase, partial [Bacteroidota bacterium]